MAYEIVLQNGGFCNTTGGFCNTMEAFNSTTLPLISFTVLAMLDKNPLTTAFAWSKVRSNGKY